MTSHQHRVSLAGVSTISFWLLLVATATALGCGGESRPPAGAEACLGAASASKPAAGYGSIGLPSDEPDLVAWVVKEQGGLVAVTTRPCEAKMPTRLLQIPADAKIVELGRESAAATLAAGQRLSVWLAGGSTGTARAVLIERRAERWPPAPR